VGCGLTTFPCSASVLREKSNFLSIAGARPDGDRQRAGQLQDVGWFGENAAKTTHPVAQKRPNAWGLYDMLGNVAEWCHDVYDAKTYATSPDRNPRGPNQGKLRVLRGGAWNSQTPGCRPTSRAAESPGFQDACFARGAIGFRCVRGKGTPGQLTADPLDVSR